MVACRAAQREREKEGHCWCKSGRMTRTKRHPPGKRLIAIPAQRMRAHGQGGVIARALDMTEEADKESTEEQVQFRWVTTRQSNKGRRRAWIEARARKRALSKSVPAVQPCPDCKSLNPVTTDVCTTCGSALALVIESDSSSSCSSPSSSSESPRETDDAPASTARSTTKRTKRQTAPRRRQSRPRSGPPTGNKPVPSFVAPEPRVAATAPVATSARRAERPDPREPVIPFELGPCYVPNRSAPASLLRLLPQTKPNTNTLPHCA